jgi:3-mercaptopyruvate sulfurtransferase SseA/sterol desaturase/sphingolipid hydroxylase (fatty acid hydroxylase superfamily)
MAWVYPVSLAIISALVMLLERLFPWRPDQRQLRKGLGSDLVHLVFNGHFLGLIVAGIAAKHVLPRIDALVGEKNMSALARNAAEAWPLWAQIAAALMVLDLVQWCVHNLLHRVPLLWEFHKTHHSVVDGEMDWIVSFRFQWVEVVIYKSVQYVPLTFFGFAAEALLVHAVFGTLIGHLNHANLDLGRGWWRYVLNSPRMHIWHHDRSADGKTTVNFGIIFSVWDWIAGTAKMTGDGPWPRLGFDGVERFPRGFLSHTAWPLSRLLEGRSWLAWVAPGVGALLIAAAWMAGTSRAAPIAEIPMLGEHTAASQPHRLGREAFDYPTTEAEADLALHRFGEEATREGYAHPEYMVSTDELARALSSPRLLILDVRPRERFEEGHVPSARPIFRPDYAIDEPIPGLSRGSAELELALRARGVRATSVVVVYGDGGPEPYRLWWTLRAMAGISTRVLEGGLGAWKEAGHAIADGTARAFPPGDVKLDAPTRPPLLWSELRAGLLWADGAQIVDTRSDREYLGTAQHPEAARAGRIPGSIHLEWLELLRGPRDARLKDPDGLRQAFLSHKISLDRPIITVCQSGTRSAAAYFALVEMGIAEDRFANYNGSWAEYSRLDLPAEIGPPLTR